MALEGFFQGLQAGHNLAKDTAHDNIALAKEALALQGLNNDYGDSEVLRADALRNAQSQYNFDTATRNANLDTLYRTHDGFVDATVNQNLYARDNYQNQIDGLEQWGVAKNQALLDSYQANSAKDANLVKGYGIYGDNLINSKNKGYIYDGKNYQNKSDYIDLTGDTSNQLAKDKLDLETNTVDVQTQVMDATKPQLVQQGILNVDTAGKVASDKNFDAGVQVMINPYSGETLVNNAKSNLVTSKVGLASNEATADDQVATNVNKSKTGLVQSETGLTKAQTDQFTGEQTLSLTKLTSALGTIPESNKDTYLSLIIADPNTPAQDKVVARQVLQQRQANQQAQKSAQLLQTNPLHWLLENNIPVSKDASGSYVVNGQLYTEQGIRQLAQNLATGGNGGAKLSGKALIDYEQASAIEQENIKQLAQMTSKLIEDGYTGEDLYKGINFYRDQFGLTGKYGRIDEKTGELVPATQSAGAPATSNSPSVANPYQTNTPQSNALAIRNEGINKNLWYLGLNQQGQQVPIDPVTGDALSLTQMVAKLNALNSQTNSNNAGGQ